VAATVEDWQQKYEDSLTAPGSLVESQKVIDKLRGQVEMVLAGASVESLRAYRPTGPQRVN